MKTTEVLVIGGGIGGLTIALKLVQRGVHVTLVEKLPGNNKVYKGELLQPKSMQIFDKLGMHDLVKNSSKQIDVLDLIELDRNNLVKDQSFMDYRVLPQPYNASYMIHHEELKKILRDIALTFEEFTYYPATSCTSIDGHIAQMKQGQETFEIQATYIIGAEGRASVTRKAMNQSVTNFTYNHHFLTVTFPRPENFEGGQIISTYNRFLGLFPLPDNQVRSVYLIPAGEYKKIKEKPIAYFHKLYTDLAPAIDGYVQELRDWKKIQLMIPIKYHADKYTDGHLAIIGDAAHAVHPMAGEGMNMAIQDADVLGELLADILDNKTSDISWYEKVRRPRVSFMLQMSHLSALAYSFPYQSVSWFRRKAFERIEEDPTLHYKQMLNVSGLGIWKESIQDRFIQGGLLPKRMGEVSLGVKEKHVFNDQQDYPWKRK
ncbi:FAD-dependent oxidoreductase [Paenisporosarcina cavernae]|uniref:FAD-dependent monooxygenase n=1 Tax=Paenisporosarcina cavernae TaxID=2320858 RepID=A0A385YWG6_9BACL|nr:NAD(P)/FAD-dependent oxidoreductase [Paenisporosarcina cavernae]AYC30247.1 FAD-dependent monooxygenase [Paenisporosarcina cavernae]